MSHKSSTITQAIGPKKSKRASASTVTEEDFLDDDGEVSLSFLSVRGFFVKFFQL